MSTPEYNTVEEFLLLCDHKPVERGKKLVRCSACTDWIREGERYITNAFGVFHLGCK